MNRKTIKLLPHDDDLLRQLHRASRVPVDQWAQRPKFLARFIEKWNSLSGRNDTADEIRHYILTKRKAKKWFRFGDEYDRMRSPGEEDFTEVEWAALRAACAEMNVGRDQFATDENLRDELADRFYRRTGRRVWGDALYAAAMAMQKHSANHWPKVNRNPKKGLGFADIDQVS
jgi:hypothetical protein